MQRSYPPHYDEELVIKTDKKLKCPDIALMFGFAFELDSE